MLIIPMRKYLAEFLGVAILVATVIGAGFMAAELGADPALSLFMAALAVGSVLFVLITTLIGISGAQLNPVVTMVLLIQKLISPKDAFWYVLSQLLGGFVGAVIANSMFEQALVGKSSLVRAGGGQLIGELVASFGLVFAILVLIRIDRVALIAPVVGAWVLAGHLFTSSTSFANPAVTLGRGFTDAISGIHWDSVPGFVVFQTLGALLALAVFLFFYPTTKEPK